MKISNKGLDLLKSLEGLRLHSYLCIGNVRTIGWGSTQINGRKVKEGDVISVDLAEQLLMHDIQRFESLVESNIKTNLTQNQFDALVIHSFNTGGSETLFELINKGESLNKIRDWIENTYITANGKVVKGLIFRRIKEANLYCFDIY
jgi:lysozyme